MIRVQKDRWRKVGFFGLLLVLAFCLADASRAVAARNHHKLQNIPKLVAEAPVDIYSKNLAVLEQRDLLARLLVPKVKPSSQLEPLPGVSYRIVVDKSDFQLAIYKGQELLVAFPCAIGLVAGQKEAVGDMRTPTGEFTVDDIDDSTWWSHDFGDGRGEIEGAYGPWFISLRTPHWSGIGIHGTHDPQSIGTRASEGCVRLQNKDLIILRKFVKIGTKVTIQE